MKIGLQTWGSDGDIMPFIALAIGLRQAGHEVTLAYTSVDNKDYSSFAANHDISFIKAYERFDEDPTEVVSRVIAEKNPIKGLALIMESHFVPAIDAMYGAAKMLCRDNDLVIGHSVHYPLAVAAEKANRPRVSLALCHMIIETGYVSPFDVNLGKWLNSLLWDMGDRIVRKKMYGAADKLRKKEGLPPLTYLQKDLYVTRELTLVAVSSALCPRRPDWGGNIHVSGFLNPPDSTDNWRMPAELSAFLEAGRPPVYFTFGSFAPFDAAGSARLFLEAARKAGVRAIIQSDWNALPIKDEGPDIYKVQSLPHAHVFPHCAMIVHHGGAGTTQSSLRAGKPSVVVAHAFDQPYWGKKLRELGVAGDVLHRRKATADDLAESIRFVLDRPQMSENARRIGRSMDEEDGVGKAVALIEAAFQK